MLRYIKVKNSVQCVSLIIFLLVHTSLGYGWQFIQMTDTHIGDQTGTETFKQVIPAFNGLQPRPEFIINTGDLTELGTEDQFSLYSTFIHQIHIPVHSVMGNHEVRWSDMGKKRFERFFGNRYYSFDHNGIHFVALDVTIPLQHHGHFYRTQLTWLKKNLKSLKTGTPVILAMHHPPASDGHYIDNDEELFDVIRPYNVIAMLVGHGHIEQLTYHENVPIIMTRATLNGGYKIYDVNEKGITAYTCEIGKTVASNTIQISLTRPIPSQSKPVLGQVQESTEKESESNILWKIRIADGLQFPPAVGEGKLFYGTEPGELYALEAKSGKQVWKKKVNGAIVGSPAYADGVVYIASMDGAIYSFRAGDGKTVWKFQTGGIIIASPRVHNNLLYVGSGDHKFYAIDCKTGKKKWEFTCKNYVSSRAAARQDRVYFGSWDGNAYCLDAYTGAPVWINQVGKSIYWAPSVTEPILTDNKVIYTALELINKRVLGRVYAFDAFSGATVWTTVTRACQTSPAVNNHAIYTFSLGGEVNELDAGNGNKKWTIMLDNSVLASEICISNGSFYIPLLTDGLEILNPANGQEIKHIPISTTGFLLAGPVVYNGICYQSAFDGTVVAISLK